MAAVGGVHPDPQRHGASPRRQRARGQNARDVYTRRGEGLSIWVVPSAAITASDPAEQDMLFEPTASKIYRHPSFYEVPEDVGHM